MLVKHQPARLVQTQPLLILQRTHRRELAKVMMERGRAHLHPRRQVFHAQHCVVIEFEPVNRLGDTVALPVH